MALLGIDYVVVIMYLVGILALGFFFKKFVHSSQDYFLGGKMLPFWAIGMSLVVTDIGAVDFVGAAGQAYRYGLVVANFDWLGSVPGMMLAAFIFIPYYWKSGVYTIPEYMGRRYNLAVRTIESLIWVIFLAFNLGVIFWASSVLLNTLMGWSIEASLLVTAGVVGIYTIFGGLSAVVMTDVIQLIIMYLGGAILLGLGLYKVGGWEALVHKVTSLGPEYQNHFTMVLPADTQTPYPWNRNSVRTHVCPGKRVLDWEPKYCATNTRCERRVERQSRRALGGDFKDFHSGAGYFSGHYCPGNKPERGRR